MAGWHHRLDDVPFPAGRWVRELSFPEDLASRPGFKVCIGRAGSVEGNSEF